MGRIDAAADSLAALPAEVEAGNRAGMGALIEIARGSELAPLFDYALFQAFLRPRG